jgi:DNA-binding response OmpR family regulator
VSDPVQARSQFPTILLVEDEPAIRTLIRRAFLLPPFTQDALLGKIREVLQ